MGHHLVGFARVGKDTELRKAGQYDVADVALAFKFGRAGDDGKKPTQWIKATIWGNYAKGLAPHLKKGAVVYTVLEELHIETFQRREGGEGFNLVGKVLTMDIISKPDQPAQRRPPAPPPPPPPPKTDGFADMGGSGFDDMDSDIPY